MKRLILFVNLLPLLIFAEDKTVGYLGVTAEDLSEAMKISIGVEYGVLVEAVSENSPTEKADIKIGDIILEIAGNKITDYETLKDIIEPRPNKTVDIVIYRSGKKITKEVVLGEKKKTKIKFELDVPDFNELKELLGKGNAELKKEIDKLKEEIENLKKEIEELKNK